MFLLLSGLSLASKFFGFVTPFSVLLLGMASIQAIFPYSQQYTFESPRHQEFHLPGPFLEYISQNLSVYKKLIQSCKYFFARHQLVPMKGLYLSSSVVKSFWNYDKVNCCLSKDDIIINLKKTKLWIYDSFTCYDERSGLFTLFLKSVHRCTPTSLRVWRQDIEVNEFSKISANIKDVEFHCFNTLFFSDKIRASLFDILISMPKIERLMNLTVNNSLPLCTKNSIIPILPNLKEFIFAHLPKKDFPMFAEFVKLHPNTKFDLAIAENFVEIDVEAFKKMLEKAFPNASITRDENNHWCEFKWISESQYVSVIIEK